MQKEEKNARKQNEINNRFLKDINERADQLVERFLIGYFLFGVMISMYYDTWSIGLGVGGLLVAIYYLAKKLLPGTLVNQYVASAAVGIFMGQFIYQMHGMFEMHFFAFIGATILIAYQNWKMQIPLAIVIVFHHAIFGYLQYQNYSSGGENAIFFTQLDYMNLQTFFFHCALAVCILFVCGLWSYDLRKRTLSNTNNIIDVEEMSNNMTRNLEYASLLAQGEKVDELEQVSSDDLMGSALSEIQNKLIKKVKAA